MRDTCFIGALDDRYDISVKIGTTYQALSGIAMMVFSGLKLESLGNSTGPWDVHFGFGLYRHAICCLGCNQCPLIHNWMVLMVLDSLSYVSFAGALGIFTLPKWKLCTCVLVLLIYCRDFTLYHVKPWCLW